MKRYIVTARLCVSVHVESLLFSWEINEQTHNCIIEEMSTRYSWTVVSTLQPFNKQQILKGRHTRLKATSFFWICKKPHHLGKRVHTHTHTGKHCFLYTGRCSAASASTDVLHCIVAWRHSETPHPCYLLMHTVLDLFSSQATARNKGWSVQQWAAIQREKRSSNVK